jgi:hypothetical protein
MQEAMAGLKLIGEMLSNASKTRSDITRESSADGRRQREKAGGRYATGLSCNCRLRSGSAAIP